MSWATPPFFCTTSLFASRTPVSLQRSGYDYFSVHDGTSTAATRVLYLSGTSTPGALTMTGQAVTLRFTTDSSVVYGG